jgi:hypothetical protein
LPDCSELISVPQAYEIPLAKKDPTGFFERKINIVVTDAPGSPLRNQCLLESGRIWIFLFDPI